MGASRAALAECPHLMLFAIHPIYTITCFPYSCPSSQPRFRPISSDGDGLSQHGDQKRETSALVTVLLESIDWGRWPNKHKSDDDDDDDGDGGGGPDPAAGPRDLRARQAHGQIRAHQQLWLVPTQEG